MYVPLRASGSSPRRRFTMRVWILPGKSLNGARLLPNPAGPLFTFTQNELQILVLRIILKILVYNTTPSSTCTWGTYLVSHFHCRCHLTIMDSNAFKTVLCTSRVRQIPYTLSGASNASERSIAYFPDLSVFVRFLEFIMVMWVISCIFLKPFLIVFHDNATVSVIV